MEKQVIITIQSEQDSDGDQNTIELITSGTLEKKNGRYKLSYKESEATGMPGVLTEVAIESDRLVTVTRRGETNSQLIFEKGARHMCHYNIGVGDLFVCVSSAQIYSTIDESGGDLIIDYVIEINSAVTSENRFHINVKEAASPYAKTC